MASTFLQDRMPLTVYADPGSVLSLTQVLTAAFGANWQNFQNFWIASAGGADYLAAANFSYWDPNHPSVAQWNVNGTPLGHGFSNQQFVSLANLSQVTFTAGNAIDDTLYLTLQDSAANQVYSEYRISIVSTKVTTAPDAAIDPQDIVASALRFNQLYGGVYNTNDCGWITDAVGAAAGAPLPSLDQSIVPTENREGGYWRIVHRGSDNPVRDWQSLVQPGDIVRFDWADPSQPQHTTMIMGAQRFDGTIQVFDNNARQTGVSGSFIGLHTANYDDVSAPASVTIYRVSPDHRYLVQGSDLGESLLGTILNDDIRTFGGNDVVYAGSGDDVIRPGNGNDTINGDDGLDTVVISSTAGAFSWSVNAGVITVTSGEGVDTLNSVERLQFSNGVVAFDIQGNAGNAYRLYQAAFNRTPDQAGLSFWTHQLDLGVDILAVAQGFVNAAEFHSVYGTSPSNAHIVDLMYQNVLGRTGEPAGINFWVGQLNNGLAIAALLQGFAVSSENHGLADNKIAQGIVLDTTAFLV